MYCVFCTMFLYTSILNEGKIKIWRCCLFFTIGRAYIHTYMYILGKFEIYPSGYTDVLYCCVYILCSIGGTCTHLYMYIPYCCIYILHNISLHFYFKCYVKGDLNDYSTSSYFFSFSLS
jgi:hypothetical protein